MVMSDLAGSAKYSETPQRGLTPSSSSTKNESIRDCKKASNERKEETGQALPELDRGESYMKGVSQRLCQTVDDVLIKGFHPAYFVTVMGSGITSCLLYRFPYPARWLQICGYIMFGVAVVFFLVTLISWIISMVKYPHKLVEMHTNPTLAPFVGCLSMGYTTLVNFLFYITGKDWIIGIWVLWWISVFSSLYCTFVVFCLTYLSKRSRACNHIQQENIQATILLPIVTLTVSALAGNLYAGDLPSMKLAIITIVLSFILWCIAIALAFVIITVYYWRLFVFKIPCSKFVFTTFLPVGVLGQGSFGILLMGKNVLTLPLKYKELVQAVYLYCGFSVADAVEQSNNFSSKSSEYIAFGMISMLGSIVVGLFLISFGYFSTYVAAMSCLSKTPPFCRKVNHEACYSPNVPNFFNRMFTGMIRFNKGYWAMTFPLGTMALGNNELATALGGAVTFRAIAAIYAVSLFIITIGCTLGTYYKALSHVKRILAGHKVGCSTGLIV